MYYSTLIKFFTQHLICYRWETGSLRMRNAVRLSPEYKCFVSYGRVYNTLVLIKEVLATKSLGYWGQIMSNGLLGQDLPLDLHTVFLPPSVAFFPTLSSTQCLNFSSSIYTETGVISWMIRETNCPLALSFTVKIQISWFPGNFSFYHTPHSWLL